MSSRPIDAKTANAEIQKFLALKQPTTNVISEMAKIFEANEEIITFHSSNFNAFLFEKEDILRFFETSRREEGAETATHLMVILGAHFKEKDGAGFEAGSPTVIVAGVVPTNATSQQSEESTKQFRTLKIEDPATEYPSQQVISKLPVDKFIGGDALVFTIE